MNKPLLMVIFVVFIIVGQLTQFSFADDLNAEDEEIYQFEVAYQINKYWHFNTDKASPDLRASIVFKVMPDGNITDIMFHEKSGNEEFDDSVYNAIINARPVKPFPKSITKEYVQMGLHFTPEKKGL